MSTGNELIQKLKWRYATKQFDRSRKVSDADWKVLEEALVLSPSSAGLQPWHFTVIKSSEMKKKLTPVSYNQAQIESCSHLVVFSARTKVTESHVDDFMKRVAEVREISIDSLSGYKNMVYGSAKSKSEPELLAWTSRQIYIALGFLLYTAALLDIDACPMEGFESAKYDEILGLKEKGFASFAICALGYRSADDKIAGMKKVRFLASDVIETI